MSLYDDILYGMFATYFLFGLISALVVMLIILAIVARRMEKKVRRLEAEMNHLSK